LRVSSSEYHHRHPGRRFCCDRPRIRTDSEAFADTNKEVSTFPPRRSLPGRSSGSKSSNFQINGALMRQNMYFAIAREWLSHYRSAKDLRSTVTEDL
jgi:hypothetical protein